MLGVHVAPLLTYFEGVMNGCDGIWPYWSLTPVFSGTSFSLPRLAVCTENNVIVHCSLLPTAIIRWLSNYWNQIIKKPKQQSHIDRFWKNLAVVRGLFFCPASGVVSCVTTKIITLLKVYFFLIDSLSSMTLLFASLLLLSLFTAVVSTASFFGWCNLNSCWIYWMLLKPRE